MAQFLSAQPNEIRYLFIDFNAFFASVEQHDDPALRGRPVMVTPLESEYSGAIAASYEAKKYGIRRGTSVVEARQLYPGITIRPARHDRYVAVHHLLMREIERHLPITRICSIDECLCALDGSERSGDAAFVKARQLKQAIARNVGESLTASIGLAPTALLAKLASELQKPDGLTMITLSMLPHALEQLPLRSIPGIGEGVEHRLARAGIIDFRDLWGLSPRQARAIWNSVAGERFIYALHGFDIVEQPVASKKMIGHSRVLSGAYRRPEGARIVARALILKAASRLRRYGLHSGALHLTVKMAGGDALGHDARFRPTQNSWRLLRELDDFWRPMVTMLERRRGGQASFKKVSAYLHELQPGPPQRDLFVSPALDEEDARQARLWSAIDAVNRRYGARTLCLEGQRGLDLNYLGVKIAFSRVPEVEEFEESGGFDNVVGTAPHKHESRTIAASRVLY